MHSKAGEKLKVTSMNVKEQIESYISDNNLTLESVVAWTYSEMVTLFGSHSGTYFNNIMRPIIAEMQLQLYQDNMDGVVNGVLGDPIRASLTEMGYDNPDAIFDAKNMHVIIRLNGQPAIEEVNE